jgi:hypothetical protein
MTNKPAATSATRRSPQTMNSVAGGEPNRETKKAACDQDSPPERASAMARLRRGTLRGCLGGRGIAAGRQTDGCEERPSAISPLSGNDAIMAAVIYISDMGVLCRARGLLSR